ncbi:MAG: methylmalonyl Co-A mutase-associated GTPase MeaB, partial [Promethearchaeota archaeon]
MKNQLQIDALINKLFEGKKRAAARLITLVENDIEIAAKIAEKLFSKTGHSYVLGVTGAPGSGKSTMTNKLISLIVNDGFKVGVIAIDPTSPFSGGALLGDRIRMKENFANDKVFIRSMANRGLLGGLARATKDILMILDAFGCDYIIIETVGVGQSEVDVHSIADTTLLLLVPGTGDDIQAAKAGIMEVCDIFVINKMDLDGTNKMVMEIEAMLKLGKNTGINENNTTPIEQSLKWQPPVMKTNARMGIGVKELWDKIREHETFLKETGFIKEKKLKRFKSELEIILKEKYRTKIEDALNQEKNPAIKEILNKIMVKQLSPYKASNIVGEKFI